ncbi:DEAD box protein/DEAH protein box helicase [Aphelenchoides avenae]|nr:DEAD box protein/DEAH protein box helicase [Aphelenchus avenae]
MPKIIKASGKRSAPSASKRTAWSGAEVAESVGFDANLKFLYSFEEIDPVAEGVVISRAGRKKEKKAPKKTPEKKKKKPRKQSKSDKIEQAEQNGHESEALSSEEKPKKRKKKLRKKAPVSEKPAKEAKKDGKKRKAKPAPADPQSPAKREKLDMNEWSALGLSEPVMEALEAMGYTRPTQIQKEVIPVALTNRCDVLGAAETGSGKTLAFAIPMVERLLQTGAQESDKLSALVLAPTRELALQYTRKNGQKGVVLTPEDKLKRLVQAAGIRKERKVIDISQKTTVPTTLVEKRMNCADLLQKDATVYYLLKRYPGRTLIFTNSIDAARRLRGILVKLQLEPPPQILHARMIEKKRLKNLERFTESENSVLISTDVAARGLDIKGVKNVVHYQVPKTAENYVHRSGRTARASSSGMSVLLVDPTDVTFYHRICKNLKRGARFAGAAGEIN